MADDYPTAFQISREKFAARSAKPTDPALIAEGESPFTGTFEPCHICKAVYPAEHATFCSACWPDDPKRYWPCEEAKPVPSEAEAVDALVAAAIGLRDDLLRRAEWDGEAKVVCAGNGAWYRFNEALEAIRSRGSSGGEHGAGV